jgi:hypothetical protein
MIIKIFYFHIWHIPQFGYIRKLEKRKEKEKEKENPGTCFQVSINSNHHGFFLGVKILPK